MKIEAPWNKNRIKYNISLELTPLSKPTRLQLTQAESICTIILKGTQAWDFTPPFFGINSCLESYWSSVSTFLKTFFTQWGVILSLMLPPLTGSARSESACCPGQRGVWPPVVRGNAECRTRCPGRCKKYFWTLSFKSHTKMKCPNVVRVDAEWRTPVVRGDLVCPHPSSGATRSVVPVVQGNSECQHLLSGETPSVNTRCPWQRGNLIGQLGVNHKIQNFS